MLNALNDLIDLYNENGKIFDEDIWQVLDKYNIVSTKKYLFLVARLNACGIFINGKKNRFLTGSTLCIRQYFDEISNIDTISEEKQLLLLREYKLSDNDKQKEIIKQQLVEANLKLVIHIAKSFKCSWLSFEDLIQEGNVGLLLAVEKYDETMGSKFNTYAYLCIKNKIIKYIDERSKIIRIPANINADKIEVNKALISLKKVLNRDPSIEEIAQQTNISINRVKRVFEYNYQFCCIDETELTYDNLDKKIDSLILKKCIADLPLELKRIIILKYIDRLSSNEIMQELDIPFNQLLSDERKALKTLKLSLKE